MKLVTFQSYEALKDLINKGYLECDPSKIDLKKYGMTYEWLVQKMNERIPNAHGTSYPIWCWVKCYNTICPPKVKGEKVKGFDVKITFNKDIADVFITDFRRYSFLLNNMYIPDSIGDKIAFENMLKEKNITMDDLKAYARHDLDSEFKRNSSFEKICSEIRTSFDKCITEDSNILQGCVWRVNIEDIEKIEILKDDGHMYGSLNYVRQSGERINWIQDYYRRLK